MRVMQIYFLLATMIFVLSLNACGGDDDLFEDIKKLRGIGVALNPLVSLPSTEADIHVVELTVHAALPIDEEVDVNVFEDEENLLSPNISELSIVDGSEVYEDFELIRHFSFKAQFNVPTAEQLGLVERGGVIQLRYAFLLTSGVEEEKIVGKVIVVSEDSKEADITWKNPAVDISEPDASKNILKGSEIEVKATLEELNDEPFKIGWFSSGGMFKNRRAQDTKWTSEYGDKQVLILTARGKHSHAFSLKIVEYDAN